MTAAVIDIKAFPESVPERFGASCATAARQPGGRVIVDPADYPDTTAYLNAIPGMAESIIKSVNAPMSEFEDVTEALPDEIDIDPADYPDTTAYLNAIPGMAESLIELMNAPASEFEPVPEEYFNVY